MRQRREIPAGTNRALFGNDRRHIPIEHFRECLQGTDTNSGMTSQQGVDADRQHRPHHLARERLTDANGMRDDQVFLQLIEQRVRMLLATTFRQLIAYPMRAKQLVRIASETSGDTVDRFATTHLGGKKSCSLLDASQRSGVQADAATGGNIGNIAPGQLGSIQFNRWFRHHAGPVCNDAFSTIARDGTKRLACRIAAPRIPELPCAPSPA